ncbi:hypothetical protein A2W14_05585 [Candidatus Gottesmanbacteria bacterium RBG_16_37_8]|uniref:EfeO-type cupredoxin-like domain-containing protein n=1 Tax=Candidatus Gottesmanbacteria bacterium RBG_16_37_8 TaxID=1798371 RepID=A0A1F5YVI9_9BACT|nr:MAG: hypothetical protein A2W14_05585 [Candidatus Gottesmanbacteria bacterium RBG_16_37_8]
MNKKFLIIILLITVIIMAGVSFFKSKSQKPISKISPLNINNSSKLPPEVESAIQSEGIYQETFNVNYSDKGFTPQEVTIKLGSAVTWTNNSKKSMYVASNDHPSHDLYPQFDQLSAVGNSGQYSFVFDKVGSWGYHNHASPSDTARVIVTE